MTKETDAPLRLEGDAVDIWLTPLAEVSDGRLSAYEMLLSEAERTRWQRFKAREAADQYLVGRALLRTTLSRYAPVPELGWTFETNDYGCPYVSQPASFRTLRFNLSHTAGLVACAVTSGNEIGVDVENTARAVDPLELAPTVFARPEIDRVATAAVEHRRTLFFAYWTLKEAYVKARGMGVSLPLDGFWFELGDIPHIQFTANCPDRPERWHFRRWQATPHHALAAAVATASQRPPRFHLRWAIPDAPAAGQREVGGRSVIVG
jgi:4'-phosphopantetheinyl transferase